VKQIKSIMRVVSVNNNFMNPIDINFLNLAHELAIKQEHISHPNPSVGCIIVKDNTILSSGVTERAGQRHAEIVAIDNVKNKDDLKNSTIYVTLEPCSHYGRTPPCINSIVKYGINRVVIGMKDPNINVNGQGINFLRSNNIAVEICDNENLIQKIKYALRGFLKFHMMHKSWIRLKLACSLDGVMALDNNVSKWITGEKARMHNHKLRARAGAVVSGINTIIYDNPLLNVRLEHENIRQPLRIILDTYARGANYTHFEIFKNQDIMPLLWICSDKADTDLVNTLKNITNVLCLPLKENYIDLKILLEYLYSVNINEVHVEGGANLISSFLSQNLFDEIALYQAPIWLGNGKRLFSELYLDSLDDINCLEFFKHEKLGKDMLNILLNKNNCLCLK